MIIINRKTIQPVLAGFIVILITSCLGTEKLERKEREEIEEFLHMNPDLNFELKPSGLYYLDIIVGTGVQPAAHDTAYIFYTASFLNNFVFDTNVDTKDTLISAVNDLLPGFEEAVTYMNVGGKSLFIVPSDIGFGQSDVRFPAYTPILYEVDLVRVKPGPGAK